MILKVDSFPAILFLNLLGSIQKQLNLHFVDTNALVEIQVNYVVLNHLFDIVIEVLESYFVGHNNIEVHQR